MARGESNLPFSPDPIQSSRRMGHHVDGATFGLCSPGFGGAWRTALYAAWVQRTHNISVRIYSQWHGLPRRNFSPEPLRNRAPLLREIVDVLDTPEPIEVVEEFPVKDVTMTAGVSPLAFPCPRTRVRWKGWTGRRFKRIAYQVDGGFKAKEKNPRPVDMPVLRSFVSGYRWVRLGKHQCVKQCVREASTCDLFFGVDSGMQQMCYAIGLPTFLLTYRQTPYILHVWHGDRHAIHCRNTGDFVFKARRFLGLRA